jgi:hypothetical protein
MRVARSAGSTPNASTVAQLVIAANASTRPSGPTSSATGSAPETIVSSTELPDRARIIPIVPPNTASSSASARLARTRRGRSAPIARQRAISRRRIDARASIRFARFAQATSRTRPTTAIRIRSGTDRLSRTRDAPRLASATIRRLASMLERYSALSVPAAVSFRMRS